MEIIKTATAGSLESSDVLVTVHKADDLEIEIDSTVMAQFGRQIKNLVEATLEQMGVSAARVVVEDKGALDFILKARLEAALFRAAESTDYSWNRGGAS